MDHLLKKPFYKCSQFETRCRKLFHIFPTLILSLTLVYVGFFKETKFFIFYFFTYCVTIVPFWFFWHPVFLEDNAVAFFDDHIEVNSVKLSWSDIECIEKINFVSWQNMIRLKFRKCLADVPEEIVVGEIGGRSFKNNIERIILRWEKYSGKMVGSKFQIYI